MYKEIDCRGLACPAPVLQTKRALDEEKPLRVRITVDNEAARENVTRFLQTQKYSVTVEGEGPQYHIMGQKGLEGKKAETQVTEKPEVEDKKIMVMVATDRMGYGDDELGTKLLVNFIKTLKEMGEGLWRLVLVNNGVKLTIDESDVLPVLKDLENDGLAIMVCGTCLTHFNLLEKKRVGETTNMLDIVMAMQLADKVITI